jgi:hypothetical protein
VNYTSSQFQALRHLSIIIFLKSRVARVFQSSQIEQETGDHTTTTMVSATPLALITSLAEVTEGATVNAVSRDDVVALRKELGASEEKSADVWVGLAALFAKFNFASQNT